MPPTSDLRTVRLVLLLTLFSLNTGLNAQHGPRVGFGLATRGPGVFGGSKADMMPAPLFGWHVEARLHDQVSFMPEVLWMTKGSYVRNPALRSSTILTMRYVEVPLLLKVSTDKKPNGMFILIGPGLGWFIQGREQRYLNGEKNYDEPIKIDDIGRRSQFSVTLGFGLEGRRFGFDVRGQSSTGLFDPIVRPQNQVYAITVTYRFNSAPPEKRAEEEEEQ